MKRLIMISAVTIVVATLTACSGSSSTPAPAADTTTKMSTDTTKMVAMDTTKMTTMDTTKTMASTVKYTCRMHPEVISDKPGKCPKCGMQLVEVKSTDMKSTMTMKSDSTMMK
ncbi:MAG TPA: heavy metal-binding domain-containing protein [Ferruginibacter sp.]|nr:heavy metal-binding domain-containing protein [Ferruginibacter sp.]